MKILHVVHHFYPCSGGVETHVYDLCRQMISNGHRSDVVCFDTCSQEGKLPPFEVKDRIRIYRIPHINLKYYKLSPFVLKFLGTYDIIHIHGLGFFSDFLTLTKPFHRKPLILSTHGGMFHTKKLSTLKNVYFYAWDRLLLKWINMTIAISKNDYELFSGITHNITYIPNGIDTARYAGKRTPKKDTFLFIGRIAQNKRMDNLLKTFAVLKETIPNFILTIAGGGSTRELELLAKQLGIDTNVMFSGKVSEKKKLSLLKKAEFFVSSSEYEGFGISVLEAMASGATLVVNKIESFANFITSGKDGFLVDFGNPEEAAKEILKIRKSRPNVSAAARKTAEGYEWKTVINKIESVYKNALKS